MRTRRGFTLVELLVVIGIILLLIALISVLMVGVIDRTRNAKTHAIVKMMDEGCHRFKVDYGVFPPLGSPLSDQFPGAKAFTDSQALHFYLGSNREIRAQYSTIGSVPKIKRGPIVEFKADMLELTPGDENLDPAYKTRRVIDAWGNPISYENPGVKNKTAVDIGSKGKSEAIAEDDIGNWQKEY